MRIRPTASVAGGAGGDEGEAAAAGAGSHSPGQAFPGLAGEVGIKKGLRKQRNTKKHRIKK